MGRAAMIIDIVTVWGIGKDMGIRTQGIKNRLCDGRGRTVCAVQCHLSSFKRMHRKRNKIAYVAISSGGIVHGSSDFISFCKRYFPGLSIQVGFNFFNKVIGNLFSVSVDDL